MLIFLTFMINNTKAERNFAIYNSKTGEKIDIRFMAESSLKFDVVFFGEFHDDSIIHAIEKDFFADFLNYNKKAALSMEMFERDAQPYLNDFLSGKITEEEFLKNSRPWSNYSDAYKPLVDMAKENKLPVIAANIPRKYASIYATQGMSGIEKLPSDERKYITRNMAITDDGYQKKFFETMVANFAEEGTSKLTPNQENTIYLYYGAQLIKDETMAESIVDFIHENPGFKVIHYCGDFHSNDYLGTVQKVKDRDGSLKLAVITPVYVDTGDEPKYDSTLKDASDFQIVLESKPPENYGPGMMGGHLGENYISSHKIKIELDPGKNFISGVDHFTFKNPVLKKSSVWLLKDLKIKEVVSPDGKIKYDIKSSSDDPLHNEIIISPVANEVSDIEIEYEGKIYHSPDVTLLNVKHSHTPGIITDKKGEGIYLPGGSYCPQAEKDIADIEIQVTLPKSIKIITSGIMSSYDESGDDHTYIWKSELPTDEMILVGGKYMIKDTTYDGKKFSAYVFDINNTTDMYLNASIDYYKLYSELLGPYPYSSFSIVENFFATGFGMPGYTLLSNKLMAIPWVVLNPGSLAHEFVHNWWGNSVYVDYENGNWCEALTTFCSNYYYNILTKNYNAAVDWRKKALLAIETLPEADNYPVKDFKSQKNNNDAVVGYSKGGFIFYEMQKLLGEDRFFDALKNFAKKYKGKRAYWYNLTSMFDEQNKKDSLDIPVRKVMNQWLNGTDIPSINLSHISENNDGSISFVILQDLDKYISVPVRFNTDNGYDLKYYTIESNQNNFSYKPDGKIKTIELDPDYQVLRHLNYWEIPYSFNLTLNDNPLLILPSKLSKSYAVSEQISELMKESEYKFDFKSVDDLQDSDWENRSIIVLGDLADNNFFEKLNGNYPDGVNIQNDKIKIEENTFEKAGNILLVNCSNPKNEKKFMSVIQIKDMNSIDPIKRLFHYMSYSMVLLSNTKPGRPMAQMEIFPKEPKQNPMKFVFDK